MPADHPLWRCPNVLISPHVAGRDRRRPEQLLRLIEANLSRFLAGEPLPFEVA